jgi:hypothetical protein
MGEVEDENAYVSVELAINQSNVSIKRKKLMLKSHIHSRDEASAKAAPRRSRSRSIGEGSSEELRKATSSEKELKRLKWVIPGIIVRVISKKVAGGRLYNQKVKVTDVLSAYQFQAVHSREGGS